MRNAHLSCQSHDQNGPQSRRKLRDWDRRRGPWSRNGKAEEERTINKIEFCDEEPEERTEGGGGDGKGITLH